MSTVFASDPEREININRKREQGQKEEGGDGREDVPAIAAAKAAVATLPVIVESLIVPTPEH